MRKNIRNRVDKMLEVPDEVTSNVPKVTILKFEQMLIENYKGILEYQDFFIRLKTSIGIININGFNLSLEEMTSDDIIVKGKIESVDFESIEDYKED
jgi:sporulation protein YqfC